MEKKYKILIYILVGIAIVFAAVYFGNRIARQKILAAIEEELKNSNVEYEDITVDLIDGSSVVKEPRILLGGVSISAEEINVVDLNYKEYFSNKKVVFDRIVFVNPDILIDKADTIQPISEKPKKEFQNDVKIKHVVIEHGRIKIKESDTLKKGLFVSLETMDIYDLHITQNSVKNKIPFNYSSLSLISDSLSYVLNHEHQLKIKHLSLEHGNLDIKEVKIIPLYSKAEFDSRQKVEKDMFELSIPKVSMKGFKWGFNGEKLQMQSALTSVEGPVFKVYRNKLLPDDNSIKPLYSQKLRELGTKIKFDTINITDASIFYEEKSVQGKPAGKLKFTDLDATAKNISNWNLEAEDFPLTSIKANAKFMGESQLNFEMEFDIRDVEDKFNFSGNLEGVSADGMNSFLKPALNIEVEGRISSMFFNFYGNDYNALGDTRLQYHDFKVEVLRKDGFRKNKFLSGVANLILKNNTADKKIDQKNISTTRDRTKSFWNFLWLCIRNGALKSFI